MKKIFSLIVAILFISGCDVASTIEASTEDSTSTSCSSNTDILNVGEGGVGAQTFAAGSNIWVAQSFSLSSDITLTEYSLQLQNNSLSDNLSLHIEFQADCSGDPCSEPGGIASDPFSRDELPTDSTPFEGEMTSGLELSSGNTYWMIIKADFSSASSGSVVLGYDTSAGYSSGSIKSSTDEGSNWTASSETAADFTMVLRGCER